MPLLIGGLMTGAAQPAVPGTLAHTGAGGDDPDRRGDGCVDPRRRNPGLRIRHLSGAARTPAGTGDHRPPDDPPP